MTTKAPERVYIEEPVYNGAMFYHQPIIRGVEYIRADLAMCWVPVAEAGLQDGEVVDIWCEGRRFANCKFKVHAGGIHYLHFIVGDNYRKADLVTHILRIRPPAEVKS